MKNGNLSVSSRFIVILALVAALLASCLSTLNIRPPKNSEPISQTPRIYPDYVDATVPYNVAPLNMRIEEDARRIRVLVVGEREGKICVDGPDAVFPIKKWRKLLEQNRGADLNVSVFIRRDGKWRSFEPFKIHIANDPIDAYVAYRLIEPGYDYANRIELVQRDLTTFNERVFFDNRGTASCVNCHSFQNRQTDKYLIHFRAGGSDPFSGTIVAIDGKVKKISGSVEELGRGCSYPAWRPTGDLVAFSSNKTFQAFHTLSTQKIEVFDVESDLIVLNARDNTVRVLTNSPDEFETFPSWSQDGKALYYCVAKVAVENQKNDKKNTKALEVARRTHDFRYNVMKLDYDEKTDSFSEPTLVVDATAIGKSALFPRVSPDGRFLVYTVAESGTFPIWRPEADLWIKDLTTGEERPLNEVNARGTDSYHTWDSSGRWLVFSSRREDGQYTRLYFAYCDANGEWAKPFVLPQKDPQNNRRRFKSYNVPELTVEPIRESIREFNRIGKTIPQKTTSQK